MRIGILRIGQVDVYAIDWIQKKLPTLLPRTACVLMADAFSVPDDAFDERRRQHRSDVILEKIRGYAERERSVERVLGVVDFDIFVPPLNFVFGEANCPGKAALISLYRLRPEFHGEESNVELLADRCMKEAIHELGHTMGLEHCHDPSCVMYFSNSILETDRKRSLFCNTCFLRIEPASADNGDDVE